MAGTLVSSDTETRFSGFTALISPVPVSRTFHRPLSDSQSSQMPVRPFKCGAAFKPLNRTEFPVSKSCHWGVLSLVGSSPLTLAGGSCNGGGSPRSTSPRRSRSNQSSKSCNWPLSSVTKGANSVFISARLKLSGLARRAQTSPVRRARRPSSPPATARNFATTLAGSVFRPSTTPLAGDAVLPMAVPSPEALELAADSSMQGLRRLLGEASPPELLALRLRGFR